MARISGVDIPREKRLEISLTYIFGIGKPTAQRMCADLDISPNTRVRDLTDEEVNKLRGWVDKNVTVEGDLRREVQTDIKRKIEIGCLQGVRHRECADHERVGPYGDGRLGGNRFRSCA